MSTQAYEKRWTVEAKTASYTITSADGGKMFTNRGDTDAITFTLPAVSASLTGMQVEVFAVADFAMGLAATAGEMIFKNDAAANSVAYSTSSEIIGGGFRAICDGTSWLVSPFAEETQTITVAT